MESNVPVFPESAPGFLAGPGWGCIPTGWAWALQKCHACGVEGSCDVSTLFTNALSLYTGDRLMLPGALSGHRNRKSTRHVLSSLSYILKTLSALETEAYSSTKYCNFPYLLESLNNLSCPIFKSCLALLSATHNVNPYQPGWAPRTTRQLYIRVAFLVVAIPKPEELFQGQEESPEHNGTRWAMAPERTDSRQAACLSSFSPQGNGQYFPILGIEPKQLHWIEVGDRAQEFMVSIVAGN